MIEPSPHLALSNCLINNFENQANLFLTAIDNIEYTQHQKLFSIMCANSKTAFGKEHDFFAIKHIDDYRKRVTIREYNDYAPYIDRILSGETSVLTEELVCCFEPTSGSTGHYKLIPYTRSLYQEFQNGIAPWLYDLYKNHNISSGRFYWSITPALNKELPTNSKIPIGIENDFNYFNETQQRALIGLSAIPLTINASSDIDQFKQETLIHLLLADDLTFISIWNPDYLTSLFNYFNEHAEIIFSSMDNHPKLKRLKQLWARAANTNDFFVNAWPDLKLISCWADASAAPNARALQNIFPNVSVQGKGLISTEAFISFPFRNLPGHILAVCSHFYEFRPLGESNNTYLAHELEIGNQYEVIVTTRGGLYRYNLHDVVEVVGHYQQAPLLKFLGRNHVIDQVGEKINELQLSTTLQQLEHNIIGNTQFLLCSPEHDKMNRLQYTLFIASETDAHHFHEFARLLEESLMKNYHYQHARQLGQLDKVRIFRLHDGRQANEAYLARLMNDGKQLGQIKPAHIDKNLGWSSVFKGEWL